MEHMTIRELPRSERPYEKCEAYGAGALSDAELLAVILRSGTPTMTSVELAVQILSRSEIYPGLMGLYHASLPELKQISGIGRVKALQLLCIAELSKRMARLTRVSKTELFSSKTAACYFMEEMRTLETEHFYAAFLDGSSRLIRAEDVFSGTINMATVSPREVLRQALIYDAASLIILHNHPSGDPTPSPSDRETTRRFLTACEDVGIPLVDHIIIGDNTYMSFVECGLMDPPV